MAIIDEEQIEKLKKLATPDGKIMITDDMPSDLKNAISYLNQNDISLFKDYDEPEEDIEEYNEEDFDEISENEPFEELEPFDDEELKEDFDETETLKLGKFL